MTKTSVKEKLPLLNSDKKAVRVVGYAVYVFVAVTILGAMLPDPDPSAVADTGADDENLTADDVERLLPRDERDSTIVVAGGNVTITRPAGEYPPKLSEVREDMINIFKDVFKDNRVEMVEVVTEVPLVDKYGQSSIGTGTVYTMTRATAQKVNWDRDAWDWEDRLDSVADYYFVRWDMD